MYTHQVFDALFTVDSRSGPTWPHSVQGLVLPASECTHQVFDALFTVDSGSGPTWPHSKGLSYPPVNVHIKCLMLCLQWTLGLVPPGHILSNGLSCPPVNVHIKCLMLGLQWTLGLVPPGHILMAHPAQRTESFLVFFS